MSPIAPRPQLVKCPGPQCKVKFWRTRKDKQFCSGRCRTRKWLLEQKAK